MGFSYLYLLSAYISKNIGSLICLLLVAATVGGDRSVGRQKRVFELLSYTNWVERPLLRNVALRSVCWSVTACL
jgi:hypothetical protein